MHFRWEPRAKTKKASKKHPMYTQFAKYNAMVAVIIIADIFILLLIKKLPTIMKLNLK